jgi:hypothetical protein
MESKENEIAKEKKIMKRMSLLLAAVSLLSVMGAAQASVVTLDLQVDQGAGTWELYGSASLDNNGGIAGFNIDLVDIASATVMAPKGYDMDSHENRGFTIRSADLTGDGAVFAGQNTTVEASLIYGIGQYAGTFNFDPGSQTSVPWDAPVLLASGTCAGGSSPWFGDSTNVNVFTDSGITTHAAGEIILTPEPAVLSLLALGAVAMLRRRRN